MIVFYVNVIAPERKNVVELHRDGWNDWFTYRTLYRAYYYDSDGNLFDLGTLKIGQMGLNSGSPDLSCEFKSLGYSFFSLGQSVEYYEQI